MALDADTGKVVWEYKFNLFQSDVPPHRIGWASPAADPETGNIYALSGGAAGRSRSSRDGKLLWERSFGEECAAFTTHGGRTMSPLVDGDLVIVSAAGLELGHAAQPRAPVHRPRQADRRRRLRRQPGRPARTTRRMPSPLIATINGMRLLIAGLGDGAHPRHQAADRREGLELRRRQARHQHGRRRQRQHRASCRTATRTSTGNELGLIAAHRRLADRRHQDDEVGGARASSSASRRRSSTASASTRSTTARRLHAFDIATGKELWTLRARHGAEGAAGAGRRQDLRRHRRRQVLHRPAARRPRRDPERGRAAEQHQQLLRLGGHAGAGARRRRRSRAAASSSCRATRSTPSARGAPTLADRLRRGRAGGRGAGRAGATCRCRRPSWC